MIRCRFISGSAKSWQTQTGVRKKRTGLRTEGIMVFEGSDRFSSIRKRSFSTGALCSGCLLYRWTKYQH
jgi:hypothetical protein